MSDETPKFELNSLPLPIVHRDFEFTLKNVLDSRVPMQARTVSITPSESWQVEPQVYDADEPTIVNNTELLGDTDG